MRACIILLLALGCLASASAAGMCSKAQGWKKFTVKRGNISESQDVPNHPNYGADVLAGMVEEKGKRAGCRLVGGPRVANACMKLVRTEEDRGRRWEVYTYDYKFYMTYRCSGKTRVFAVRAKAEVMRRFWGSSFYETESWTSRRV